METTQKEPFTANDAIDTALAVQANNFSEIQNRIEGAAKMGWRQVALMGVGVSQESATKLMRMGYSLTLFTHPMDALEWYKITW
jgi:hypothetical protein